MNANTINRLDILDGLRGFALLGILLANIRELSGYSFLDDAGRAALTGTYVELTEALQAAFIDGKFYTLFSLLFGIGFALQLSRLERDPTRSATLYLRRVALLLAIGLVHLVVFWIGDILTFYALLGFFLFAVRGLTDTAILRVAGVMFLLPIAGYCLAWSIGLQMDLGIYAFGTSQIQNHFPGWQGDMNALFAVETWPDFFAFTTSSFWLRIGYNLESWRMFKLAFIMLMGLWVGRQILAGKLLDEPKSYSGYSAYAFRSPPLERSFTASSAR